MINMPTPEEQKILETAKLIHGVSSDEPGSNEFPDPLTSCKNMESFQKTSQYYHNSDKWDVKTRVERTCANSINTSPEVLDTLVAENEFDVLMILAKRLGPPNIFEKIAKLPKLNPQISTVIVNNPDAPDTAIDILASYPNEFIRGDVAKNPRGIRLFDQFINDKENWVIKSALTNPKITKEQLIKAAKHPKKNVRKELIAFDNLPKEVLEILTTDKDKEIRNKAQSKINNKEFK
jgi:hypothetical protein